MLETVLLHTIIAGAVGDRPAVVVVLLEAIEQSEQLVIRSIHGGAFGGMLYLSRTCSHITFRAASSLEAETRDVLPPLVRLWLLCHSTTMSMSRSASFSRYICIRRPDPELPAPASSSSSSA